MPTVAAVRVARAGIATVTPRATSAARTAIRVAAAGISAATC
jgi:hypothetical protein